MVELQKYLYKLDEAYPALQEAAKKHNKVFFVKFNSKTLTSEMTEDECFQAVTGKTKKEHKDAQVGYLAEIKRKDEEHKEAIPTLTIEWIEKGKKLLDSKYHELWEKCVPIRLGDLYKGMELGATLEIIEILNSGEFDDVKAKAKETLENQNHSGMSFGLMCNMLASFHNKGVDFVQYAK